MPVYFPLFRVIGFVGRCSFFGFWHSGCGPSNAEAFAHDRRRGAKDDVYCAAGLGFEHESAGTVTMVAGSRSCGRGLAIFLRYHNLCFAGFQLLAEPGNMFTASRELKWNITHLPALHDMVSLMNMLHKAA